MDDDDDINHNTKTTTITSTKLKKSRYNKVSSFVKTTELSKQHLRQMPKKNKTKHRLDFNN